MADSTSKVQVIVAQLGARRHYLVPVTFHSRGMLARFETDFYLSPLAAGILEVGQRLFPAGPLRRMTGRIDDDLPASRVHSFPLLAIRSKWRLSSYRKRGELTGYWLQIGREFGRRVAERGFDGADAVYGYSSASLEVFEAAKASGKLCILDHATAPKRFEDGLTMQQAQRYPGWAATPPIKDRWVDEYADRQNREAELADLIICGSTFVKTAVEQESGQGAKCAVIPLGLRRFPEQVEPKAIEGERKLRILFVGDEAIRKGIGDLCGAIRLVGSGHCEVRVAGNIDLSERGRLEIAKSMTLLGPVPRVEMASQYQWADICVLPSVSDTFGLVILESLSYGVPVITTPNTGGADVVTEGITGHIVPIMSPESIADRIDELCSNRARVSQMSAAAIERSRCFGIEHYADRLVSVVNEVYVAFRDSEAAKTSRN